MPRHSHQDAVDERTFKQLLDAADKLDKDVHRVEAKGILYLAGRLGLRAGEIAHLRSSWVDWEKQQIQIPYYQECTKGRDGGMCGYCKKQSAQNARKRNRHLLDTEYTRLDDYEELAPAGVYAELYEDFTTTAEMRETMWSPKTHNSARAIPFGFSDEIESALEEFFFHFDRYSHSRVSVNRRVDAVAEKVGIDIYPHALRATAASWHAYRGVPAVALQALMGWAKLAVAQKYIKLSGGATARALEEAHR